jgi:acyl-CoA thioester hydrolase
MSLVSTAARPHPDRMDLSRYPVRHAVEARFGDMDANRHLNNLALEAMHENARATMNTQVFPGVYFAADRSRRLVAANSVVHFLRESHWPATIHTGAAIGRIGRTSYVASTGLFVGEDCISLCDTVLVLLGDDGPTPILDEDRARLTELMFAE